MISRFKRIFALPAILAALFFIAGCGAPEQTETPSAPAVQQSDTTVGFLPQYVGKPPEDGGTLIRALPSDVVTLNPVIASDMTSYLVYKWIFDPLVDVDQDMKPVGVLAESWENDTEALTTTFHLRRNVLWHDGEPFTADDVLFTYDACMDPTVDAINKRPSFEEVEKVEKVDDYTVRVTWKEPFAPGLLSWNLHIIPKHLFEYTDGGGQAFNRHPRNENPVGTGPYRFVEWNRGEKVTLTANTDYFMGRPHIENYIFKVIPPGQSGLAAYQTGELNVAMIGGEQWKRLKDDKEFLAGSHIFEYYGRGVFYIGWNMDGSNPFFGEKGVRQAMSIAVNRQGVIDNILMGSAALATSPFTIQGWERNPDVQPLPYDPARAAALLEEAGWKDSDGDGIRDKDGVPFSFECLTPAGADMFVRFLELFQQDYRKIGVEMQIRQIDWGVFQDRTHRHQFQAYLTGWSPGDDPDPFTLLHSSQAELLPGGMGVGQNDVSYRNPEVDRLIQEQRETMDFDARQKLFWKIHELVAEDQPHTYLFSQQLLVAVNNRYQNVRVSRAGYGLFSWYPSVLEWWIPKELQK